MMIITIDGYDGTGKTSLAKKIAEKRRFVYIEKPFIIKYQCENNCSYKEAVNATSIEEKQLYVSGTLENKIRYYLDGILWLKKFQNDYNIVLDRGILTTYAVFGTSENENIFIEYLKQGISFEQSIYLVADDMIRHERIIRNNPNDLDLNYPIKWRKNNLEEFAEQQKINYYKIITDTMTKEEVVNMVLKYLDNRFNLSTHSEIANNILIKKRDSCR